jgi:hypothetical protein
MRKQKNISFLILNLLILLFYPGIVQLVHKHHHEEHICCQHVDISSFTTEEDPCPVCDFQFVSFIGTQPDHVKVSFSPLAVIDTKIPEKASFSELFYFSLRAPPKV